MSTNCDELARCVEVKHIMLMHRSAERWAENLYSNEHVGIQTKRVTQCQVRLVIPQSSDTAYTSTTPKGLKGELNPSLICSHKLCILCLHLLRAVQSVRSRSDWFRHIVHRLLSTIKRRIRRLKYCWITKNAHQPAPII